MEVLRAGRVFDGERLLEATDVVVEDGRVGEVNGPGAYPGGVTVTDHGPDATILPGLVDTHVHLTWNCSTDPLGWFGRSDDDALLERARANARTALAAGITTVRDLGDRRYVVVGLKDELDADPGAGPAVVASGPPVTTSGGHCWFLGGEVGDTAAAAALAAAVAERADSGVDVVKIMVTGGNVTPGSPPHLNQFELQAVRAVVEAAHQRGMPVATHAHGADGVEVALEAGVDTIEHCSFMSCEGVEQRPALVERLAVSQIPVVLTAGQLPGSAAHPAIAARMPALVAHAQSLVAAGVRTVLATDAGVSPGKPHDVLRHAIAQVVTGGVPATEALHQATARAADAVGLRGRAGRVRSGEPADLLVVDGDPVANPAALLRTLEVRRSGMRVGGGTVASG